MTFSSTKIIGAVAVAMSIAAASCVRRSYVIGAVCPGADGGTPIDASCGGGVPAGTTFAVDLDKSGTSLLGDALPLGRPVVPSFRLRGERAATDGWPIEGMGGALIGLGGQVGLPAPF